MRNVISRGMDAALRALVTARQLKITVEGSSGRLFLTPLRVYTIVVFSQTESRTRMRATLDGTVLQDLGKPLCVLRAVQGPGYVFRKKTSSYPRHERLRV